MSAPSQVKQRFLAGAIAGLLALAGPLSAADAPPDAQDILSAVRAGQTAQHATLKGQLRNGPKAIAFQMTVDGSTVRYEFAGPPPLTMLLRLGEKEARLSEVTKDGAERISGKHWGDLVEGSDLSFEDLSLRFLYWSRAQVEGEETMLLRRCWVLTVLPPTASDSQYSRVKLWVEKESGTLLQAEAFDKAGHFARRFKVVSGQKIEGAWYLKQMRVEAPAGAGKDSTPTYLEIQGVEH